MSEEGSSSKFWNVHALDAENTHDVFNTMSKESLNPNMILVEKLLNLGTSVTDLKDHWVTVDKDLIFVPEKIILANGIDQNNKKF